MAIGYKQQSQASVTIPPNGAQYTFIDSADGKLKRKDSLGVVVNIEDAAGGVASFEGRSGAVVSQAGDYTANEIVNIPNGNLASTNVQSAIDELDAEKAPISHVGTGGAAHLSATNVLSGFMSASDKSKLDAVEAGATANQTDAYLLSRSNHTGTQSYTTVTGLANVASSGAYADLSGSPSTLPPSGSASGELSGSYPSPSLVNSAVISKVLTGLVEQYGIIAAADSLLQAISKLAYNSAFHLKNISSDLTIPSGYVMIRGETRLDNGKIIRIESGGVLKII